MATIKFRLRNPESKNKTLILCVIRHNNKRFDYSTGESIESKYWDKEKQRVKESISKLKDSHSAINLQLQRYKEEVKKIEATSKTLELPITIESLREGLNKAFKKQDQPTEIKPTSLIDYIEKHIKEVKNIYRNNVPYPINSRTKQKYNTLLSLLKEFTKHESYKRGFKKGLIKFEQIDLNFYNDFIEFLQKEKTHSHNTAGKYITTLKVMLNRATEEGINTNLQYKTKRFATLKEEVNKIFLSENELLKLYNLKFKPNQKGLERARDLFLIGCYTSLRYSDFTTIQPENIVKVWDQELQREIELLKIKTDKTGETVTIPLHWIIKEILTKYNYQLPPQITNQKFNEHLKDLGEKAEINDKIVESKTIGGYKVSTNFKKYQLITTHTARRSGATNMFLAGIPAISIMKITGHKTEKVFLKYICIDSEQNAVLMQRSKFFSDKPSHLSIAN